MGRLLNLSGRNELWHVVVLLKHDYHGGRKGFEIVCRNMTKREARKKAADLAYSASLRGLRHSDLEYFVTKAEDAEARLMQKSLEYFA